MQVKTEIPLQRVSKALEKIRERIKDSFPSKSTLALIYERPGSGDPESPLPFFADLVDMSSLWTFSIVERWSVWELFWGFVPYVAKRQRTILSVSGDFSRVQIFEESIRQIVSEVIEAS